MLLLCILVGGVSSAWADDYELYSGTITEGDYLIVYSGKAMNTTVEGDRLQYATVTVTNDIITTTNTDIVWHIAASGDYWTLYNAKAKAYAASTGAKNKAQMLSDGTDDKSLWTVTGSSTYEFVNKKNTASKVNANLRNNGTYGFACYATGTGGALSLYKKKAVVATALAVKTAPTKLNYKVGEKLDLTGLVLDATVGGNHVDVTTGYTAKIGETAVTSGTTVLNSVRAQTVTFTYGGQTTTQTIHVGELTGIEITTEPDKTEYNEGQTFDPTGMVVTATFSDGEESATEWTEDVTEDCTFEPDGALTTSDTEVTVSYEWDKVNDTADQNITVTAGVPYTVTFDAGSGSCGTASLTEASFAAGVTLPTATIGVTGWSFAGWATVATSNTDEAPTLYAASSTYKPTDNITLYAVYKFADASAYKRATSVSDITSASSVVIVSNANSKVLDTTFGGSVTAPTETSSKITAPEKAIFTLTGNNSDGYTLTNSTTTIGATSTDNSTQISSTTTNKLWVVKEHNTSNTFYFENVAKENLCLEHYNSSGYKWMVYAPGTPSGNAAVAMKVYVPVLVYNSNPAAMVNPTVAFTIAGNKSLYVKDDATYDNAANAKNGDDPYAKTITYTSSDETVATVTSAGVVTALKAGETTITAKVAKEIGVNSEASTSYTVTVKDAKTIAGLKAITSSSSVVTFTADLTDAVVTYVKGSHAFIQDASGAVYASCGSSLTAGDKINGAVTGSIKAANAIDEITAITLTAATVTDDGVIPSAEVKTAAQLVANKADLEGKLVSITGATVTASLTSGSASGGKISDDSKTTEINLYAPDSDIEALKDAEGTFNGYITLYSGSTIRFNIFEQSQITLTKNAPTDQTLTFASDAVELDEETDAYTAFTGQTVSGAQGTVTYSIDSDDDDVVTSINSGTGAVVLSGNYGTATIKAAAAAKDVTEAGVTTPYKATTKTYTITVYPRYTVTFNVDGVTTTLRETAHGAGVTVPTPAATIGDYTFRGWNTSAVDPTDTKPAGLTDLAATIYPEDNDDEYYAVYAQATGTPLVEHTSTFTVKQSSAPSSSPYTSDGSNWTWSGVTFSNDASAYMPAGSSISFTLPSEGTAVSLTITSTTNTWAGTDKVEVNLTDNSDNAIKTFNVNSLSYDFTSSYDHASSYTLTAPSGNSKNAWVDHITFEYTTGGVTYSDYRTSLPIVEVTIATSGYATYCSSHPLDFSNIEGFTAWRVSDISADGTVTFTKITNTIKEGQGVILYNKDADHEKTTTVIIPVGESEGATEFTAAENLLVGTTAPTFVNQEVGDYTNFALSAANGDFRKIKAEGMVVPANKAYLPVPTDKIPKTAARLTFVFEDGEQTTGISEECRVKSEEFAPAIYDLQGRKVAQPKKGLYIVNGRKVVMK